MERKEGGREGGLGRTLEPQPPQRMGCERREEEEEEEAVSSSCGGRRPAEEEEKREVEKKEEGGGEGPLGGGMGGRSCSYL